MSPPRPLAGKSYPNLQVERPRLKGAMVLGGRMVAEPKCMAAFPWCFSLWVAPPGLQAVLQVSWQGKQASKPPLAVTLQFRSRDTSSALVAWRGVCYSCGILRDFRPCFPHELNLDRLQGHGRQWGLEEKGHSPVPGWICCAYLLF